MRRLQRVWSISTRSTQTLPILPGQEEVVEVELEDLLSIVDEAEELARKGKELGNC